MEEKLKNKKITGVYDKKELIDILNNYKGIFNATTIDYLNSLIELEFSVAKNYINENDRNALSELEIYRKIAIYNIYNRAINLIDTNNITANISYKGGYIDHKNLKLYSNESELFSYVYPNIIYQDPFEIGEICIARKSSDVQQKLFADYDLDEDILNQKNDNNKILIKKLPYLSINIK